MELLKEGVSEDSGQPVIGFSNEQQCTTSTDSPNESGLGLPLEQNVDLRRSPAHNPTYEVKEDSCETDLKSDNVAKDNTENSPHVAAELSILPLIDVGVGLGLAPKPKKQFQGDISSLSVIANYGSSSESDSDSYSENNRYFKPNVTASTPSVISSNIPVDYRSIHHSSSDDSESDSESSDDESSSSSSTDGRATPNSRNTHVAAAKVVKKKGQVLIGDSLDDLPPIEDLQISVPEDACIEIGSISSIVEQQVIIQAKKGVPAIDLGSVLFLEKGKRTLGEIFDVFGQVTEPFYSVRFNSAEHVQEKGIEKGMSVYCAPQTEHTSLVFVQDLMKLKSSDPSWEYTEDSPPHCIDYSDDDEERNNLRGKRNVDRGDHSDLDMEPTPRKRVNSFERRMNERNLRKSALPHDSATLCGGVVRGSVRGRRHLTGGRNAFVKSQFGFNHFPGGRGRALPISFGGLPPNFGTTTIGNQRMGHPLNFGPIQPPSLTLPPRNSYGPIQPPSHSITPQANGQSCTMMGMRPNGPPSDYRASQRQQSNMQHVNTSCQQAPHVGGQQPPMKRPANNGQPLTVQRVNTHNQPLPSMQCPINKSQPLPMHRVNTHNQPPIQHPNTASQPPPLAHPNTLGQRPPMHHPNNNSQPPHHNTNCQPPSNSQPPNTNSQTPPTQRPNNSNHAHPNAQPMGYPPPRMQFSPYILPANRPRMDNSDGQYPHFGVIGFMPPQTFQGGSRNNSFFSTPPPGFGAVPGFPNRICPQAFQPMYSQMPPIFYQEFQPPQLPPGALPNAMASMYSRPPPAPPNGGV